MPVPSPSAEPLRLLTDQIEEGLRTLFSRLAGLGLMGLAVLAWLSLLTWSVADPTLARPGEMRTTNLLGASGATAADVMLQSIGLVAAVALFPFVIWGLSLLASGYVPRWRSKLVLWLVSILCLASAMAALPTIPAWPIRHGFGGLIGDLVYAGVAGLFNGINASHGGFVAGLSMLAAGASALFAAMGAGRQELTLLWHGRHERREPVIGFGRGHGAKGGAWLDTAMHGLARQWPPGHERPAPEFDAASSAGAPGPDHYLDPGPRAGGPPAGSATPPPELVRNYWSGRGLVAADPADAPMARGHAMHASASSLEEESRAMAERFAPRGSQSSGGGLAGARSFLNAFKGKPAEPEYRRPSLNMLRRAPAARQGPELAHNVLRGVAKLLEEVLLDFGVKGQVQGVKPGPVVTLYEFEPARGIKASRVIGLADDIARSMSTTSARVAIVPGRNVIGIELPNVRRETVYLRELLEHESFKAPDRVLPLVLGKDIAGAPIVADLARMPHLLVAGTTGSGKSVGINAMILSLLYRYGPQECRLLMIDPKMLELSVYNGIPHLLTPVITEPAMAVRALEWAVREMEERYKRMSELSVRSIDAFNARVREARRQGQPIVRTVQTGFDQRTGQPVIERVEMDLAPLPYIVVIVDEMADLMLTAGKEIEGAVQRLAQMARAAGIHLVMATQRPSVDVVTGTIKANFPARIGFKVASKIDSRTILGDQGAEQLLGAGDMLLAAGAGLVQRVHGPFVSDEEVGNVASYLRSLGEPAYVPGIAEASPHSGGLERDQGGEAPDELFDKAVAIVVRDGKASTSYLQRRLSIGYNRAADIMERMERDGLVSPANSLGKRYVLIGDAAPAPLRSAG
jgi:S-DNA-T family DNA segregation ATPase FtsK/SpoIIIE